MVICLIFLRPTILFSTVATLFYQPTSAQRVWFHCVCINTFYSLIFVIVVVINNDYLNGFETVVHIVLFFMISYVWIIVLPLLVTCRHGHFSVIWLVVTTYDFHISCQAPLQPHRGISHLNLLKASEECYSNFSADAIESFLMICPSAHPGGAEKDLRQACDPAVQTAGSLGREPGGKWVSTWPGQLFVSPIQHSLWWFLPPIVPSPPLSLFSGSGQGKQLPPACQGLVNSQHLCETHSFFWRIFFSKAELEKKIPKKLSGGPLT